MKDQKRHLRKQLKNQLLDNGPSLVNALNKVLDDHGIDRTFTSIVIHSSMNNCSPPCVTKVRTNHLGQVVLICCCPGMDCFQNN